MKYPAKIVVSLLCAAMFILPAFAQQNSSTRGGLAGLVMDSTGAIIPGAPVVISGPQGDLNIKANSAGHYEANGLVPGLYKISVEAPGFKKFVSAGNEVVIDHTANLDIRLSLGASTETVEVDGGAVQIDTETTSLNTALTDQLYNSVPVARNVASIFYFAPGVVSGGGTGTSNPSIGGASGLENLYIADGITITDQAFGGLGTYNRYYGSLGSGINLAFIKEVDVKTGAFEPKYGRADGGIVEIVTKSGTDRYHGAIAAYLGPGSWYASRYQLSQFNYVLTSPASLLSTPQYDASFEIGGPLLHHKLFFFGAFDPTLRQNISLASPKAGLYTHGPFAYSTTTASWSGKLSYQPFSFLNVDATSYGDPSHHNVVPETLSANNADSVASRYYYGSRNSALKVNAAVSPKWVLSGSYTYNYNVFNETPKVNAFQIQDRTVKPFVTAGYGGFEPTKNDDYSLNFETQNKVNLFGEHTFSVGYQYDHTNFLDQPSRSGGLYAIPGQNAAGQSLTALYSNVPAAAIGAMTNASFRLQPITAGDNSCTYCPTLNGRKVYLQQIRGTYKGLSVQARGRYIVGYADDSYKVNRHIVIDAGLRWEQQHYAGTVLDYLFNDNWSPRLGLNIDPFGDGRSKAFFNYARYQSVLPLDAAIRQLGNEQDDSSLYYAPKADASGNALLASNGSVIPVLDAAHLLNGTPKTATAKFGGPSFASSTGEGILPGTRMEYENEYVIGVEREIRPGSVLTLRYSDRRLGRIVEDIGSQSPEGAYIDGNFAGGIANVNASTDKFVNEAEVTYTPAQFQAKNGQGSTPGTVTSANYVAPVPGCTYDNDAAVAFGDFFRHFDGSPYNGGCITNLPVAGNNGGDGKPDGFVNPVRRYQEFVIEFKRGMRNHWMGIANYRFAKLYGNYEGFFRNDNGQSDPGISSLFDFTSGDIGLLGDQFKPGYLNTDRRNVGNVALSYNIGADTPYVHFLKNLTTGMFLHGSAGAPLSAFASHPVYLNTGEIPVGGRGTKGNLPVTLGLDLHVDYPVHFGERYTLKMAMDTFNVTNSQYQTGKNQNLDTSPGVISPDYGKPTAFQAPFYARASVRFEF